ncbi:unnamed protein product [Fraxinus pennsylvanica]|uniref:Uncharacterized protein n=1 Tax=Fraxinus pennsylvanica TaxID=56036 RepID=A0AAD1ZB67_9LAMI|nr:unnamed protein product [Fraxinus pennsylvanica]
MAQLTSLQTLSKMIVRKSCRMRLKDLGNLSRPQDEICILNLQNVVNVQEAIDARLMYNLRLTKASPIITYQVLKLSSVEVRTSLIGSEIHHSVKFPILSLPSLCELEAEVCNEVVLSHMRNLESLTLLKLKKNFGLTSVSKAFMPFPYALEKLEVRNCSGLETLWPSDSIAQSLVNLRRLSVRNCPKLLSLRDIDTLPVLRNLEIWDCGSLEFVPDSTSCLKRLEIGDCPSLKTMMKLQSLLSGNRLLRWSGVVSPEGLPAPNLKYLDIIGCQHLKSLPDRMDLLSSLEYLFVQFCPLLVEPFPQGKFHPNLRGLSIYDCGKLNPLGECGLHKITSLEAFSLGADYPELVSFSNDDDDEDDNHYLLPPSIMSLRLCDLLNLEIFSSSEAPCSSGSEDLLFLLKREAKLITVLIIILFIGTSSRSLFRATELWKEETILKKAMTEGQQTFVNFNGEILIDVEYEPLVPKEEKSANYEGQP